MKIVHSLLLSFAFALFASSGRADARMSPSDEIEEWAVSQMVRWSPPGHSFYPDARESEEEALIRYRSIVRDAMAVAYDPSEPPLFVQRRYAGGKVEVSEDPIGRAKTLALMLAIADSESGGYRRDVDFNIGPRARGDGGRSWCLMQVQLSKPGPDGRTSTRIALKGDQYEYVYSKSKGYGGEDLIADRRTCFRVALHMARESFRACSRLPVEERLSIYAGGDCEKGRGPSRVRVGKAIRWLAASAPPRLDSELSGAFQPETLASVE